MSARCRRGDLIEVVHMGSFPDPLPPGTRGIVVGVEAQGNGQVEIDVAWLIRREVSLIETTDRYTVVAHCTCVKCGAAVGRIERLDGEVLLHCSRLACRTVELLGRRDLGRREPAAPPSRLTPLQVCHLRDFVEAGRARADQQRMQARTPGERAHHQTLMERADALLPLLRWGMTLPDEEPNDDPAS